MSVLSSPSLPSLNKKSQEVSQSVLNKGISQYGTQGIRNEKNSKYVYLVLNKPPSLANPYVLVLYPPIHKRVVVVTGSR